MQTTLRRISSGAVWNFPSGYFSVENLPLNKSKIVFCQVKTNFSTRLQSVAGGLEIQPAKLRTVSPRCCHYRALWPHPALMAGLALWSVFLTKHHGNTTSMVHGIVSAREGTMLHRKSCGQARNVSSQEGQGYKVYQLQLPRGNIA